MSIMFGPINHCHINLSILSPSNFHFVQISEENMKMRERERAKTWGLCTWFDQKGYVYKENPHFYNDKVCTIYYDKSSVG